MLNFDSDAFHSPAFAFKNLRPKANLRLTYVFCVFGVHDVKKGFDNKTMSNMFA